MNKKQLLIYVRIAVISAAISLFVAKNFTHYFNVPVIATKVEKVTEPLIIDKPPEKKLTASTREIMRQIDAAKSTDKNIIKKLPENVSEKKLAKEIAKTNGKIYLVEGSDIHTGYNIYSIRVNKHKHALGLFTSGNLSPMHSKKTGVGLHYRNNRVAYELRTNFNKDDIEARIIWEAIQW